MELVNLTPHSIVVFDPSGERIVRTVEPSGYILRLTEDISDQGMLEGIPLVSKSLKFDDGFVNRVDDNTIYIVSAMMLSHVPIYLRNSFVAPDTGVGSVVRSDDGRIAGVRRFMVP